MKEGANHNIGASNLLTTIREIERIEKVIPKHHPVYSILHFLVWEAHTSRLVLEILFMSFIYQVLYMYLNAAGYLPLPHSLHFGILGCFALLIIFIDTQVLCKSNGLFRKAYLKSYTGNIDRALELLHGAGAGSLPPTPYAYHLAVSEFHLINGSKKIGDFALESALKNGANPFECVYLRMRSLLFSGSFDKAFEGVSGYLASSPLLQFEYGVSLMAQEDKRREARKYFQMVLDVPSVLHPSGAETHDLSHMMLVCLDLNSGKAEESLPRLNMIFELVVPELKLFPALRPYASIAYLERAKYYSGKPASHKRARYDLERALAICSYPLHKKIAESIL